MIATALALCLLPAPPASPVQGLRAPAAPLREAAMDVDEPPLAPDGRRGLGADTELPVLLRLFRTPDEAERDFLAELAGLGQEVALLVDNAAGVYRSRGYFAIVDELVEPTCAELFAEFHRLSQDPDELLFRRDPAAIAFARMHLDTRFRARMALIAEWEHEVDEVRRGLAVLDAAADTFVVLSEQEGANVATRVDLAASFLRATLLDLSALREAPGWPSSSGPTDEEVASFLALSAIDDLAARRDAVLASQAVEVQAAAAMVNLLASTRLALDPTVDALIAWRGAADRKAAELLAEAERLWPDAKEPREVEPELAGTGRTARRQAARLKAIEGLLHDPLDDRLAYLAAVTSRVVHGDLEALSHYDRFLALRGIRFGDDRTYRKRELTWEEADALLFVQQKQSEQQLGGQVGLSGGGAQNP